MARDLNKIKQKQYIVTITETVREDFVIAAHNKDEVIRLAQSLYRSGQLVLEPGELIKIKFEAQAAHRKTRRQPLSLPTPLAFGVLLSQNSNYDN